MVLLRLQRYIRINDLWNVGLNTWLALRVSDLRVCRARTLPVLLTRRSWSLNSTLIEVSSSPCAADPFSEAGGGLGEEMADVLLMIEAKTAKTAPVDHELVGAVGLPGATLPSLPVLAPQTLPPQDLYMR